MVYLVANLIESNGAIRVHVLAVLLAVALLAASTAGCTTSSDEIPDGMARLRVAVGGLPGGVTPKVEVSGSGESWTVPESQDLDVAPGTYSIRIRPVRAAAEIRYGAQDAFQVEAVGGRAVEVDARYRVTVPDTTKIIPDPKRSPIVSVADGKVVLRPSPYANALRPGDTIVAGDGPHTRGGLSRKVLSISRTAGTASPGSPGSTVVATTRRVPLYQAMPAGRVSFRATEPSNDEHSELTVEGKIPIGSFEARSYLTLHDFSPGFDADLDWNIGNDKEVEAWLSTRVDYDITAGVDLPYKGERDLLKDEVELGGRLVERLCGGALARTVIKVAKVGLVSPECEVKGRYEFRASAEGGLGMSYRHGGTTAVTLGKGAPPPPRWERTRDFELKAVAEGSFTAAAGVELEIGVGDLLEFSELRVGLTMEWGLSAEVGSGRLAGKPFVRFGTNLSGKLLWGVDGEVGLSHKTYDLQPEISRAVGTGELNEREFGYTLAELTKALPKPSDLPAGFERRTHSFYINPYCPEEYPKPGCPFARRGVTAWATFLRDNGKNVLWVQARVFPSKAAAAEMLEWTREQRQQWDGPFQLPDKVLDNGIVVKQSGAGRLTGAKVGEWTGHHLIRSMDTELSRGSTGPGVRVESYFVLSHHNVTLQVGAVGGALIGSPLSPGRLPGNLTQEHQDLAATYLAALGEPG